MLNLSVSYENEALRLKAEALADQLKLPIDNQSTSSIYLTDERLCLKLPGLSPLYVDFSAEKIKEHQKEGKKQAIVRACKPAPGMRILDVTAGWGRDALILASLGAEVLMLERHPIMATLLADALERQKREGVKLNLSLLTIDAKDYLTHLEPSTYPNLIYLDPMHPAREKSALVKKNMQVLQQLAGADLDALELLQLAMRRTQKVVVKWPQKKAALLPTSTGIEGKTVRYDIYTVRL